jgi:hypothetical protein
MVYAQYVINIAEDVGVIMHVVLRSSHGFQPQVGVSLTGCISHLVHKGSKMSSKCCTCTFKSIQGMHYDSTFACIMSKFRSKNSPHLLLDWCSDVGIQDISYLNIEVIQGCNSQGQVQVLT